MKRINLSVAFSVLWLCVGSSFAMQGRGPGRVGVTLPGTVVLNRSLGNDRHGASVVNQKSPGSRISNSDHAIGSSDTHGFRNYGQYVAAQHVSEHLGVSLDELRAKMTGDNPESLGKAIQDITGLPESQANAEAKKAEQAAREEAGKQK